MGQATSRGSLRTNSFEAGILSPGIRKRLTDLLLQVEASNVVGIALPGELRTGFGANPGEIYRMCVDVQGGWSEQSCYHPKDA